MLDSVTRRNLELVESLADGGRRGTLLDVLDHTRTAMGGRLLREWILRPLVELERIQDRLDAVEELAFRALDRGRLREALSRVQDLDRILGRVTLGTAGPRDLVALAQSLRALPAAAEAASDCVAPLLRREVKDLDPPLDLADDVARTLVDEPPALVREGGFVRDGVDPELDALRSTSRGGRATIAAIEERERARTGISSLKVRFNRVFGYYIEVSKSNLGLVPADYVRKQTIAGGERFVTPELKEYEDRVLRADELILEREARIFEELRGRLAAAARRVQQTSRAAAVLDVLASLAEAATRFDYVKPRLSRGDELAFVEGRHPIMERVLAEPFVANDLGMGEGAPRLFVLTGPNMGGKSTFLRQTALVALMAQMGSFVPAREAKIGLVDRVFTRVGASDQILRGQSTFMVEMQETAHILRHATARSLVLLDEIGRGTATFDGLSIAWAVAEHIAQGRGRAQDHLRDPLPRARRPRRRPPRRREPARLRARVERDRRLPPQDRARRLRPLLRHPGGPPRRPPRAGRGAGAGDPAEPGEHGVRPRGPAPPRPLRERRPGRGPPAHALLGPGRRRPRRAAARRPRPADPPPGARAPRRAAEAALPLS